jgi:hypothetical protein
VTRITAWLGQLHIPSLIVALVAAAAAQVSINLAPGWLAIGGDPVDLSSSAGRYAAAIAILAVVARVVQSKFDK